MLLEETDRYSLHRRGRYLQAVLKRPHRVLGTRRINGGPREDLTHIANHQSREGVAHGLRHGRAAGLGADDHHLQVRAEGQLPPASTALMAIAANMQCAALAVVKGFARKWN